MTSFYCISLDVGLAKPEITFSYLKQGIKECHRKFMLPFADKSCD